jgi:hypothetical protein
MSKTQGLHRLGAGNGARKERKDKRGRAHCLEKPIEQGCHCELERQWIKIKITKNKLLWTNNGEGGVECQQKRSEMFAYIIKLLGGLKRTKIDCEWCLKWVVERIDTKMKKGK